MSVEKSFDPQAFLELMRTTMAIPVREEWKAGICLHLANAAHMSELLESADIDPNSLELAGVFEAGAAGEDTL